ncbi:helix-turn-helix transcriptional regulator [Streptococcus suis]|uniref:Helix-turn-helix transcriptional regulator n=1 Tax=Streptococcus suis TaxID=1307 RepID=A0A4T2GM83_STRSU|nr:helix-turn-helix transcriptional regulator [Streptococcus suis]MBM7269898.1 helix-turn-helix transcriptional regulator [Streptococcus suis]MBM7314653.1 helix-turn-helix transcriptional regulator [Streptococcus suis]TIH99789.1 helix-turn-helix transcriptional regulator [Streptococcus suis]
MNEKYPNSTTLAPIMQANLKEIRETIGWTSEDLATLIGVTKQTISNLETNRSKLSKLHYIAIRTVVEFEIEQLQQVDPDRARRAKLLMSFLSESPDIAKQSGKHLDLEQIQETSQLIAKSNSYASAEKIIRSFAPIFATGVISLLMKSANTRKK